MIPEKTNPCWRKLVTGEKSIQTEFLGLQMILKRMHRHCTVNATDAALQAAAEEVHAFFIKYQTVLSNELKSL